MFNIYLAGSVPKGDNEAVSFEDWREKYKQILRNMDKSVSVINPYERGDNFNEGDFMAVFGSDCRDIKRSNLILVNAEERLGAGTAQELVIAKYLNKTVVTILPKGTHHRRSKTYFRGRLIDDWIHPFIYAFSDIIIESLSDLDLVKIRKLKPKGIEVIDQAINNVGNKD